ncbi:MAG: hypothetical protein IT318_02265 [Anaerolineales bacterium]|nr:hypothetical protein [Anaerolineales bacterium]
MAIQGAFGWQDDHLYSFFLSGRAWDRASEIGSPWSETPQHTHQVRLSALALEPGRRLAYVFDYGDGHEFEIQVMAHHPRAAPGIFPKVVARRGQAPAQYGAPEA